MPNVSEELHDSHAFGDSQILLPEGSHAIDTRLQRWPILRLEVLLHGIVEHF